MFTLSWSMPSNKLKYIFRKNEIQVNNLDVFFECVPLLKKKGDVIFIYDHERRERAGLTLADDMLSYRVFLDLTNASYLKEIGKEKLERFISDFNDILSNPEEYGFSVDNK